jgi:hypothetical protein
MQLMKAKLLIFQNYLSHLGVEGINLLTSLRLKIGNGLREMKLETIIDNTQITINALPVIAHTATFALGLRAYMKFVHNRPYYPNLIGAKLEAERLMRNRQLTAFVCFGLPIFIYLMDNAGLRYKDMVTINITQGSSSSTKFKY